MPTPLHRLPHLRAAALAALCAILAAGPGACTIGDLPAEGEESMGDAIALTASAETTRTLGIVTWRAAASSERVQLAGVGPAGAAVVQGTITIELADNGDSVWELALERPAAAYSRFHLSESQPRLGGDARADLILGSFVRDLLGGEGAPAREAVVSRRLKLQAGDDLAAAPRMPADTPEQRQKARGALRCLLAFATQAYEDPAGPDLAESLCGLSLERDRASYGLKLYSGATPTDITAVLAFAGARALTAPGGFGDWFSDLQRQYGVTHTNPFLPSDGLGTVGASWDAYVRDLATLPVSGETLVARLEELIREAKQANKALRVFVTGHSLGAVSAALAGYDIARRLQSADVRQQVWVTIFNPPRLGLANAQASYQKALLAPCAQPTANKLCLGLWSMTRTLDPAQALPLGARHVVWQTAPGARELGTGQAAAAALPYCPQYNAPPASALFLALDHSLGAWADDLTTHLGDAHLTCMFNPRP